MQQHLVFLSKKAGILPAFPHLNDDWDGGSRGNVSPACLGGGYPLVPVCQSSGHDPN